METTYNKENIIITKDNDTKYTLTFQKNPPQQNSIIKISPPLYLYTFLLMTNYSGTEQLNYFKFFFQVFSNKKIEVNKFENATGKDLTNILKDLLPIDKRKTWTTSGIEYCATNYYWGSGFNVDITYNMFKLIQRNDTYNWELWVYQQTGEEFSNIKKIINSTSLLTLDVQRIKLFPLDKEIN